MTNYEAQLELQKAIQWSRECGSDTWLQDGFPLSLACLQTAINALEGETETNFKYSLCFECGTPIQVTKVSTQSGFSSPLYRAKCPYCTTKGPIASSIKEALSHWELYWDQQMVDREITQGYLERLGKPKMAKQESDNCIIMCPNCKSSLTISQYTILPYSDGSSNHSGHGVCPYCATYGEWDFQIPEPKLQNNK